MSDENNMLNTSRAFQLRMDVLGLMLKGAAYAALVLVGVWFAIYALYLVGLLLPPESKEALDPTPLGFNEYVLPETVQHFG